MALKNYNPTTPGQRQLVMVDRSALYKGKPVKALTEGKQSSGGRNNTGRITVRFRGGGHKKTLRTVDFKRTKVDKGGQLARSAGTYAQLVGRDQDYVIIRLNSGEQRLVHGRCRGTIGAVSNPDHMNISIG